MPHQERDGEAVTGSLVISETCPDCAAKRKCPCCGRVFQRLEPVFVPVYPRPVNPWPWYQPPTITWGQITTGGGGNWY